MDVRRIGIIFFMILWSQFLIIQRLIVQIKKPVSRRWWIRLVNKRKRGQGFDLNLFHELIVSDHEEFFGYTRMWPEQFEFLLNLIRPYLEKRSIRKPLSPRLRLSITLT